MKKIKVNPNLEKLFKDEINALFKLYEVKCKIKKPRNIKMLQKVLAFNLAYLAEVI